LFCSFFLAREISQNLSHTYEDDTQNLKAETRFRLATRHEKQHERYTRNLIYKRLLLKSVLE